ncbi:rRNA pseudouridine synthase [Candidatus Saccharibacteria bacterium]|nr:rRNA pseudouridine synthase [Candidatus Saccharibacteria bacterium]MBR3323534.1 rRNA pseudouridine synthase [Candidatus Saccharibacteria bacterium]
MAEIRLNKFLAERMGVSRREADNLIAAGKILVDGKKGEVGARVTEESKVEYRGKLVPFENSFIYLAMNKPAGYVSSRKRQGEVPTLYELLPDEYKLLKTVGRLDKDSSGLILLTNDGDFAYKMTHPKFVKTKEYEVELDNVLEPLHQQMIADFGIDLPDGKSQLGLERLNDTRKSWRVTMHEGRNRQIRRTFGALGYTVVKLHRVRFGNYELGQLKPGEFVHI